MAYVIVAVLLVVVVLIVASPLRRRSAGDTAAAPARAGAALLDEVIDLEAARDAKYREIRDAELDHQTGKLSDADYAAVDSALRAEAIEILRKLDGTRRKVARAGLDGE
jgi:hypothetical protein